jgi:ribosome-associated protein
LVAALPHRFRGFFNTLDSKKIAIACAKIADDKKAQDIVILDVDKISSITDYFVICSAINERQLHAIADDIDKEMKKVSVKKLGMEGYREGKWVLIDYGDFIVHIFEKEIRGYYDLEMLWGDAPKVTWQEADS